MKHAFTLGSLVIGCVTVVAVLVATEGKRGPDVVSRDTKFVAAKKIAPGEWCSHDVKTACVRHGIVSIPSGEINDTAMAFFDLRETMIGGDALPRIVGLSIGPGVSPQATHAVNGRFTPAETISRMLDGTGVTFHEDAGSNGMMWNLKRASPPEH